MGETFLAKVGGHLQDVVVGTDALGFGQERSEKTSASVVCDLQAV
jgi:hypothetical protein